MVKSDQTWWVRVAGLVLPAPVAGHPALELPNTWAGWSPAGIPVGDPATQDYLRRPEHLDVLATDRGLLPAGWSTPADEATLDLARELRPAAYRAARGLASDADLELIGHLATEARAHQRLWRSGAGCTWLLDSTAGPRATALAAAAALADLLTHGDPARIASCPGEGCGWLFVNASGRRRWCQMAVCGNRAKQAAYTARRGPGNGKPSPLR